jgi:hypothetical protein
MSIIVTSLAALMMVIAPLAVVKETRAVTVTAAFGLREWSARTRPLLTPRQGRPQGPLHGAGSRHKAARLSA